MHFDIDEWDALSGGSLVNITFPEEHLSILNQMSYPKELHSEEIYYDQLALVMEKHKHERQDLVAWVADAFNDMLDGVDNHPPNPYIKCEFLDLTS